MTISKDKSRLEDEGVDLVRGVGEDNLDQGTHLRHEMRERDDRWYNMIAVAIDDAMS